MSIGDEGELLRGTGLATVCLFTAELILSRCPAGEAALFTADRTAGEPICDAVALRRWPALPDGDRRALSRDPGAFVGVCGVSLISRLSIVQNETFDLPSPLLSAFSMATSTSNRCR